MDLSMLITVIVLLSVVQPLLRQRLLDGARRRVRHAFERERGSRVILLVHRQETMSLFGIPLMRYIDIQDSEEVIRAILQTEPDTPIDLILHTPGGVALASLQIARALARHPGKVTAFVPHYAMSGGTLIALAADEIRMSPHAVLGPIDPQVADFPAASIIRATEAKEAKDTEDATLILADQAQMAIAQVRRAVGALLTPRLRQDLADYVAESLTTGQWTHDYPITPDEAAGLGLPVTADMPASVLEMMTLYPFPQRRVRSVEFDERPAPRAAQAPGTARG